MMPVQGRSYPGSSTKHVDDFRIVLPSHVPDILQLGSFDFLTNLFFASSTFAFPTSYNGVEIVTYGDPCMTSRQLPYQIEGPREPVSPPKKSLSMNLKIVPIIREYELPSPDPLPIAIQVPKETTVVPDRIQGKSYGYNLEVPPMITPDTSMKSYNFGLEVPVHIERYMNTPPGQPVRPLTGLTSRVDRILVPACEVPNSVKSYGCSSCN